MKPPRQSLALVLIGCCAFLLPAERATWAHAMKAEIAAIEDERAALAFATGCVWGSIKERTLTMHFAAHTVRFIMIASMLALAIVAAVIAGRVAGINTPSATIFGLTSILFAGAGIWYLVRGPGALIRTASIMIPLYIIAYIWVQAAGDTATKSVPAELYRALAIEGVVIWAVLLVGSLFMLCAETILAIRKK